MTKSVPVRNDRVESVKLRKTAIVPFRSLPAARSSESTEPLKPLSILGTNVYKGPHYFSSTPMIRLKVDLGTLENMPTNLLSGFSDALLGLLPGLHQHGCQSNAPGGFVKRLQEGTWIGHVIEHVAIELQTCAGSSVTQGKTREVRGKTGLYNVLYEYEEISAGLFAGRLAVEVVTSLFPDGLKQSNGLEKIWHDAPARIGSPAGALDVQANIEKLKRLLQRDRLGPTTKSLAIEARRRGIPVMRLDAESLVQLGWGRLQQRVCGSITGRTSQIAVDLAGDKELTNRMLADAAIPVPEGTVVGTAVEAIQAAQDLGYPVVTKPLDGNHGRGVSIGLRTPEEVTAGFTAAASEGSAVLIERQFVGKDYRILAVNGEVVAVAERVPAHVTGDGKLTVAALIEKTNSDPRRGMGHENVLTKIKVDEHLLAQLAKQNLTLDSIPPVGSHVGLRQAANLSTGGTAIDRTEVIHPENASFAARAARILGLDIAGIDFVAPDITRSVRETGGGIVEVNASPGFRMHLQPSEGPPRNVAKNVIDMLFPKSSPARIPVFAITGTNGKSTTAQMLAHILQNHGQRVGLTTTTGVYVGGERILKSDASGPRSARMILQDPSVDVAVLESARGGILREGLAFDECDVGAVLNIAPDHLGLDEVDTLSQLAAVKSVVVESVYRNGCSVLNADDEYTFDMRRHAKGRIAFFSMRPLTSFLEEHAAGGGIVVIHEDGNIVVYNHGERTRLMAAGDIPATLGGLADFNIQNALAATAMCVGHGLPESAIRSGLATFGSSFRQCPGRLNVHDGHGFRVIVDYAHNPDALKALGTVVQKLRSTHSRVIGMVCIPGDRRDDDIRQMGAIAANIFDQLLLVEDEDNRGRLEGQTLALLKEGALAAGCSEDRITISSGEALAVKDALTRAASRDLVILIGAFIERIWQEVQDHGKPAEVHGVEPVKVVD